MESDSKEIVRVFQCPEDECGGTVTPSASDGRFWFHRNVLINVPRTFLIPRCGRCRRDYVTATLQAALNEVLDVEYQRHLPFIQKAFTSKKKRGEN